MATMRGGERMRKVIITAAVVGTRPTKEMNPAVPYTPKEIAEAAVECCRAGAASVHVHVRDPKTGNPEVTNPDLRMELFKEIMDRIRQKCDMMINLTTGAVGLSGPDIDEQRFQAATLKPDICSLHVNPEWIELGAKKMREYGVKPELETFDVVDVKTGADLIRKGVLDKRSSIQFVIGTSRGISATPENLLLMKNELPHGTTWSTMVMDRPQQLPLLAMTMVLGGHIRVGFEDNIYLKEGVLAKSNAQLVEGAVSLVRQLQYEVASPDEAREIHGLRK
jgi:3-keto-5-aminohexanoate cleavage enzyme